MDVSNKATYKSTGIINKLLNSHELNLIYSFPQNNNLEPNKNPIFQNCWLILKRNQKFIYLFQHLDIKDLKLLENYLEFLISENDSII